MTDTTVGDEGKQNKPLQNIQHWHIILNCKHLKNSKCRERLSLNCFYLPKDKSSESNLIIINSVFESFIIQGILTHHRRDRKSAPYNFVTNYHTTLQDQKYHINLTRSWIVISDIQPIFKFCSSKVYFLSNILLIFYIFQYDCN